MQRHKLANILLESSSQFFTSPALYCACNANIIPSRDKQNAWILAGPGSYDFTTFFNALSTSKWLRYTTASEFFLHLEIKGAACTYTQTRGDSYTWTAEKIDETVREIPASNDWTILDIPLVLDEDILIGFTLEVEGPLYIKDSYYYSEVDTCNLRDIELALCTTTFKNEQYILPNIDLIKERILDSGEDIAQHFTLHVVDNGRTLDTTSIETARIHVHPNPNAGGAGGFARGMIEAMEQEPKATHVLLMDDDVNVSAESILRTYALLRIVNDEYKEAFLSGAMMDLDVPSRRFEDIGFVACEGKYFPVKDEGRMDVLHDCITNEAYMLPSPQTSYNEDRATQAYAAWWYCVIPMSVIERTGMPLPVFVRTDDVEYNLRAHAKLMTMNGICVWHSPFEKRYNATVERYQMTRNVLIGRFTTGMAPLSDFIGDIERSLELEIKKFNYTNAELILDGFEDFLKGPDFIAQPGAAENAYLSHLKTQEQLIPLEELYDDALKLGVDLKKVSTLEFDDGGLKSDHRGKRNRFEDDKTLNGNRYLHKGYFEPGSVGIIHSSGWFYQADNICKKEYLIAIDPVSRKGVIRKIDRERFRTIWERFRRDMVEYRAREEELQAAYAHARETLTSIDFWKHYLGLK